jgi:hypothetical protein
MSSFTTARGAPALSRGVAQGRASCMRRVGRGDPCRVEIPVYARLDGPDAQREAGLAGTGNEGRGLRRLAPPPVAQGVRAIRRIIDHARHRPCAPVDAKGPGRGLDGGPGQRAHLPDAQPTAPHQQQHGPIPQPIDDPEQTAQVVCRYRLGQGVRHPHLMAVPHDGLRGHPAVVLEAGTDPGEAPEEGGDGRWRAPRLLGGAEPGRDVIGRG